MTDSPVSGGGFKPLLPDVPPAEPAPQETACEDRMLKWFAFSHLPIELQPFSQPFHDLAARICSSIEPGPERTVALRKLLEAKDAAVRAALTPGG